MDAATTGPAEGGREVLHPRVQVIWVGGVVVLAAVVLGLGLVGFRLAGDRLPPEVGPAWVVAAAIAVAVLGIIHALARYRVWRFALEDDALSLERGVITRVETAVPYVRVQHIDTHRGPLERLIGLSSVVVYTAGSRGADVTVPGLAPERARRLRDRLRDLAVAAEPEDAV